MEEGKREAEAEGSRVVEGVVVSLGGEVVEEEAEVESTVQEAKVEVNETAEQREARMSAMGKTARADRRPRCKSLGRLRRLGL